MAQRSQSAFLSAADDLLTRLLLDNCIFAQPVIGGRRTGKMDPRMRDARYKQVDLDKVEEIVKELRQGTLLIDHALQRFLEIPCVKAFAVKWSEETIKFHAHCKMYFAALRPDSGLAFHETDRYTKPPKSASVRQTPSPTPPPASASRSDPALFIDVAIFATRRFKKGEEVSLKGRVADLTEEEDDRLRVAGEKQDFSVLWSDRKQCFGLLLGPARFVNHDCRNNVVFNFKAATMTFKVIEDIEADEQIFTHYGEHYFDTNNACCLCSTCEQLKRGAFSPHARANAARKPIDMSPSRRSARQTAPPTALEGFAYAGSGHEVTAHRSLSRPRSSSLSSLTSLSDSASSSRGKRGVKASVEKRRSERTVVVVDEFRTRKRLLHPKLPPPPGYMNDYTWEDKKRVMRYKGPLAAISSRDRDNRSSTPLNNAPSMLSSTTVVSKTVTISRIALGKRKQRAGSDSSDTDEESRRKRKQQAFVIAQRDAVARKVKSLALGTRSSRRTGGGSGIAAQTLAFKRLEQSLGVDLDDSLSELDSSQIGSSSSSALTELSSSSPSQDELDAEEEEEDKVVERYLVQSSASPSQRSQRSQRTSYSIESSLDAGDEGDDEDAEPTPVRRVGSSFRRANPPPLPPGRTSSPKGFDDDEDKDVKPPSPRPSRRAIRSPHHGSHPIFESEEPTNVITFPASDAPFFASRRFSLRNRPPVSLSQAHEQPSDATSSHSPAQSQEASNAGGSGQAVTVGDLVGMISSRGGSAARNGGSGHGDDDDEEEEEDRKGKGKAKAKDEHSSMPSRKAVKRVDDDQDSRPPPSESGDVSLSGRDETDQEAAQLLILMMSGLGDAGPSNSSPPSAATSNDLAINTTSTPTGDLLAPASPGPHTAASSDLSSAGESVGLGSAIVLDKKKVIKRGRRSSSDALAATVPPAPSLRTSRRVSQVGSFRALPIAVEKKPIIEKMARAAISKVGRKPKTATPPASPKRSSNSKALSHPSPSQQRHSNTRDSPATVSPRSGSEDVRSTRRTQAIPGDIRALMNSPDVMAVAGGYDEKSGRYRPAGKRGKTPSPEPVVIPEFRSTRLSQPIQGNINDLIASPLVAAVSGGYDPASRRYYSRKEGNRRVSGSPNGLGSGNESSPGPSRLRQVA